MLNVIPFYVKMMCVSTINKNLTETKNIYQYKIGTPLSKLKFRKQALATFAPILPNKFLVFQVSTVNKV